MGGRKDRHARTCSGHPRLSSLFTSLFVPYPSNQILPADDFTEPRVVRNEFLDEFMHTVLEDVVHVAVFEAVAYPAGVALRGALAAIGDADLVEVTHQIAVAARQRARQR